MYEITDCTTVIKWDLNKYVEEAKRLGEGLHKLFKDSPHKIIHITIQPEPASMHSSDASFEPFCPIYCCLVMPGKDKSAVDISINFQDAIYKFIMRWDKDGD